jgi:putative hemin transport protein
MQTLLKQNWDTLRGAQPQIRIRDAAAKLYVTEAQLLATGCGDTAIRLNPDWIQLLPALAGLGSVMVLTRNAYAVHEVTADYHIDTITADAASMRGHVLGLHLNLHDWQSAFAVEETTPLGVRHSVQFFDRYGDAVHKVYLTLSSHLAAYRALVASFRSTDQTPAQTVLAKPPKMSLSLKPFELEALKLYWQLPQPLYGNTAQAGALSISRYQALSLLMPDYVTPIPLQVWRDFMHTLVGAGLTLVIGVANAGATQHYIGAIHKLLLTEPWFNVMDDGFNLHLQDHAIANLWAVKQMAQDGMVTSLEAYDAQGEIIISLYCLDARLQADDMVWRELIASLPTATECL